MKSNLRVILYVLAFGIAFILWQKWQVANQPVIDPQVSQSDAVPGAAPSGTGDLSLPAAAPSSVAGPAGSTSVAVDNNGAGNVKIRTDLMELTVNLMGGTVTRVELLDYPVTIHSDQPLALMRESNPGRFVLQSGLNNGADVKPLTGNAVFTSEQDSYVMADGDDTLVVPLTWQNEEGLTVTKSFVFARGKYEFNLQQQVDNQSDKTWQIYPYQLLDFGSAISKGGIGHVYTFTGGVMSTKDDRYNKINLDDFNENLQVTTSDGWVAMIQHYFIGALIPEDNTTNNFFTRQNGANHIMGVTGANQTIEPGAQGTFNIHAYVGPKVQSRLQEVAPALDKTVDYGFLFMIAQPMFKVLTFIHGIIGNWGWAIVLMTLLIKMLFFVPSAWAYKSMAKMRRLQPQMKRLKERYGDDRQAMSQAMMKLYREEKVNPASGCLPMLLQIPFFIAFYWVLVESVELRQAPWILWIQDLSERDPYFILPVINAALMFIQQRLNPPPPDPMQAKIMMMLPLVFGFMFMWFPSGLVLYWSVSNAFSIIQQYIMNKRYGEPKVKPSKA
ncbi:membrane protein insertase YidC [Cardiobacteriaceae bacterium TAE3-ERU3]|nr:membrane protein insertase YidC [Cardiobacteriaceae bacterium TAE3-ERU3]